MRAQQALLFAILMLVDSMHYIFARLLLPHLDPMASAFWVLAMATVEVIVFAAITRQLRWRAFTPHLVFYLLVGFLVAASTVLSYESIAFLDVGTASLLGKTTTLFSVLFGVFWLHERLHGRQIAGAVVALLGVFVIAFQPGDYLRLGSLLVLLSAALYALHTAIVKRWGNDIQFLDFFIFRLLSTAAFLLLIAASRGNLEWPSGSVWLLLLLTGTVDVTISRTLYYVTLRRLPMSVHAIILTLSPVVSIALALVIFGTAPSPQQFFGGALILVGVLFVTLQADRSTQPRLDPQDGRAERVEVAVAEDPGLLGTVEP